MPRRKDSAPPAKQSWEARALRLFFKLNADAMNYTPRSHRGQRAARLMPRLRAKAQGAK